MREAKLEELLAGLRGLSFDIEFVIQPAVEFNCFGVQEIVEGQASTTRYYTLAANDAAEQGSIDNTTAARIVARQYSDQHPGLEQQLINAINRKMQGRATDRITMRVVNGIFAGVYE